MPAVSIRRIAAVRSLQDRARALRTDGIADRKRRAGVGAACSESESTGRWARRSERGVRVGGGETGDDGGERAKWAVRTIERLDEAVGVTSRLVRGTGWSW